MTEFKHGRSAYLKQGCRCEVCKQANSVYRKQMRDEEALIRASGIKPPRLSAEPLIQRLLREGVDEREYRNNFTRWRENGMTVYMADYWAIKHGWHPAEIWGMDFYAGILFDEVA